MPLERWAELLALRLQEDATALSHSDICKALADALRELYPGQYCYPSDVYGDDSSGDVVFCCGGDYKRAPYEIQMIGGKRACSIDTSQAVDVLPRTVYDEEADEADHYANMGEAERNAEFAERFPGSAKIRGPFAERFIAKAERDAADSGSFAGNGKSFPILKPGDVMPAVRSMGRAGADNKSIAALKSSIIRIAKKKGWGKYLPKAWQSGGDASSSSEAADLELTGDVIPLREGAVGQDGTAYLKLIAPGWGSSGYYSREVLARDGPKIFKNGTKNFWDHQTAQEESARPEGSLRDLASVLTEDAHYDSQGPAGEGLYAKAKVFEQFRQPVDDLAKHIGVSIRANGRAKEGKADGKSGPIIEQLTKGISADYVTTPGAGGKILQLFEAARGRQSNTEGDTDMDEAQFEKRLKEATAPLLEELKKLREAQDKPQPKRKKLIRGFLEGIRLPDVAKERIIERAKANFPLTEAGDADTTRLKALVESEIKAEASYLEAITGRVLNLGTAAAATDPKLAEAAAKEFDESFKEGMNDLADLFMDNNEQTDEATAKARRKRFREGRAA